MLHKYPEKTKPLEKLLLHVDLLSEIENYKSKLYFFHKENLTNTYIKNTIISNIHYYKLKIKHSEISDVYVELKRKELTLKRKIKNENKQRSS